MSWLGVYTEWLFRTVFNLTVISNDEETELSQTSVIEGSLISNVNVNPFWSKDILR